MSNVVKVTNIPSDATEQTLTDAFERFGAIHGIDIDGWEATILFASAEEAQAAVKGMKDGQVGGNQIGIYALTDNY